MSIVSEYLSNIELAQLRTYKNMSTISINGMNFPEIEYSTLTEGINNNSIKIEEIDEDGCVPSLNVVNNGNLPVLLFDGEELKGAKQNRVLNTTILIPEDSNCKIPVSCTEQGRWGYNSETFKDSGNIASSKIRRRKSASVSESLKETNEYSSNQSEVWEDVGELCDFVYKSPTYAMEDVFKSRERTLEDYSKHFPFSNQNGVIVFINGKIAGMEILSTKENYQKYHKKIIKSYSLDASIEENNQDIDHFAEAEKFINEIANMDYFKKPSVGYGYDYRFVNDKIAGSLLVHENAVIHTAFFRKISENNGFEKDYVVSSRNRARNYASY